MILVNNKKSNILLKAITLAVACVFFIDTISYAAPSIRTATNLAAESKFKPFSDRFGSFSEKYGLDFQAFAMAAYAAGEIRDKINSGVHIKKRDLQELNRNLTKIGTRLGIEDTDFGERKLEISKGPYKYYRYVTFYFGQEKKRIEARFIKDHERLTEEERQELGVRSEEDRRYFVSSGLPDLEGVWFVDPTTRTDTIPDIPADGEKRKDPLTIPDHLKTDLEPGNWLMGGLDHTGEKEAELIFGTGQTENGTVPSSAGGRRKWLRRRSAGLGDAAGVMTNKWKTRDDAERSVDAAEPANIDKLKAALDRRLYIRALVETASRTVSELARLCGVKPYIIYNDFRKEVLKLYVDKLINGKKKAAIDRRLKIKGLLTAARLSADELAKLCGVTISMIWIDLKREDLRDVRDRVISKNEIRISERRAKMKKILKENRMAIDDLAAELECSKGLIVKELALPEFAELKERVIGRRELNEKDTIARIKSALNEKEQTLSELASALDIGKPAIKKYLAKAELAGVLHRIIEPEKVSKAAIIKARFEKGPATRAELARLTGLGVNTVSSYISGEEELRPFRGMILSANAERISARREAMRELIGEGVTDLNEIADKLDVSVSLVRDDLKSEELKDLKGEFEAKPADTDKFAAWYFSGEGLPEGASAIVTANPAYGIKLIREKRLANFGFLMPDHEGSAKVAMVAEIDRNHGAVVNIYGVSDMDTIDRTNLIATFKYFKALGAAEKFDPARADVLSAYFGWNKIDTVGRHFDTKINRNGYIWISARRPEDGVKIGRHISISASKVRNMSLVNKKAVGIVEEDLNHGQVINVYLAADYYTRKKDRSITPLATYKHYGQIKGKKSEDVSAVRVDLGELDIIEAYRGKKLPVPGRTATAVINKGNYGSGVCYVTMLLKTDNEARVQFGIPKRYMERGALGKRVVLRVEEDVNSGQVINVFFEEEFNSSKEPKPIATYKYFPEEVRHYATGDKKGICKLIDLAVEEILAYYNGAKDLKVDKNRAVALPVMDSGSGLRAEMKKGMRKRVVFFLFPEAAKIFSRIKKGGWRIAASLKEDTDYGIYIDLSRGGRQLGVYKYFPEIGRCTVANFGRMALMDYVLGNRNAKGEYIAPRAYLYNGVVNMRAHMISVRHEGSDHIVSRLGPLAGKTPIFVPVKDDLYGYVINVYDAETYRVNKRSPPKVRMIRYPYSKRLIPIDMVELSRAKEFLEKGLLLTAKSAIGKYLADNPGDVEGKKLSGQIAAKIREIGPASVEKHAILLADAISSKDLSRETDMLGMAKTVISKNPENVPSLIERTQELLDFETGSESSAYVNMAVFKMLSLVPDDYKTVALARSAARVIHYKGENKEELRAAATSFFTSYPRDAMFHKSKSEAMEEFKEMSKGVNLDDPISQYIRDTAEYPLLTDTGEAVLSSLAHLGDDKAAKEMAASNLRYVISMVRKYIRPYMSLYDLIGAGNDGLLKAVEKFDPARGFKFSTYATWWIRQSTIRYIQNNYCQIRIPIHKQAEIKQYKRECAAIEIDPYDHNISDSEITNSLGMEESKVRLMREMMAGITSLSKLYKEGDADEGPESTIEGSVGARDRAFEKSDRNEMVDAIAREVESRIAESSKTPERDIDIFRKRVLPLFMMEIPQTLEEVGSACGLTRERVRQIEKTIISKHVHRTLKKLKLTKKNFTGEHVPPAGSIYSVFQYALNSSSKEKPLSVDDISERHGAYDTIKHDLRALYYHLRLIERESGRGRTARYYVPERVRKKLEDQETREKIFNVLEVFRGNALRPNPDDLRNIYEDKIRNILEQRNSEDTAPVLDGRYEKTAVTAPEENEAEPISGTGRTENRTDPIFSDAMVSNSAHNSEQEGQSLAFDENALKVKSQDLTPEALLEAGEGQRASAHGKTGTDTELSDPAADKAAANEAERIHRKNLEMEYIPTIPQKTILYHIIADSILPEGQRDMLKAGLEQNMRGEEYREKIVALSVRKKPGVEEFSAEEFMAELERVKDRVRKENKGYNIEFTVACPDREGLVEKVQVQGMKALAFRRDGEGEIVQVEGILLALRALYMNDTGKLLYVYKFLTGEDITKTPKDINELARMLIFIMPARKVGVNEAGDINKIIRENIMTAL